MGILVKFFKITLKKISQVFQNFLSSFSTVPLSVIRKIPHDYKFPETFTIADLDKVVLGKSHKGSSPGISGFSYTALTMIYPAIKDLLLKYVNSIEDKDSLCTHLRARKIVFIRKPRKDDSSVSGYRPIVLLKILYKIYSSLIADVLKSVISMVMTSHQNAYQSGNSCAVAARCSMALKI